MEIVVFGAGSLGSLIGGLLATEHGVILVGRDAHADAVTESGLRIEGAIERTVEPAATSDGTGLTADLALVTVKAFDTAAAAAALATGEYDAVCSLQNGLGNEETLAGHVDATVLAGTATYGARLVEPGVVECTGVGEVVVGDRDGGRSAAADRVGEALDAAGVETVVAEDMPRRLWKKLAINAGINATTALARVENGALVDGPAAPVARTAARETARVAAQSGVDLAEETAAEAVESVAAATADNDSSMRQDLQAGRQTEIEAINGAVVERAAEHGVETPINATLAGLVSAWEDAHVGDASPDDS